MKLAPYKTPADTYQRSSRNPIPCKNNHSFLIPPYPAGENAIILSNSGTFMSKPKKNSPKREEKQRKSLLLEPTTEATNSKLIWIWKTSDSDILKT